MAYAARKAGAELREEFEVTAADFDKQQGLWTVSSSNVRIQKLHSLAYCAGMRHDVAHVVVMLNLWMCSCPKLYAVSAGQEGEGPASGDS